MQHLKKLGQKIGLINVQCAELQAVDRDRRQAEPLTASAAVLSSALSLRGWRVSTRQVACLLLKATGTSVL